MDLNTFIMCVLWASIIYLQISSYRLNNRLHDNNRKVTNHLMEVIEILDNHNRELRLRMFNEVGEKVEAPSLPEWPELDK